MKYTKLSARLGMFMLMAITLVALGCGYNNTNNGGTPVTTKGANHLYVVNAVDNSVSGFNIDGTNGGLTPIGAPVPTGIFPIFAAATPDGKFLYVANTDARSNSVSGYVIDAATGALTPTTPAQFPITGDSLPLGITVDPSSTHVYTANVSSISAFTINPATGALTEVRGSPVMANGVEFLDVKVTPDGQFLLATDALANTITSFRIDGSGLPVAVGDPVSTGQFPTGIAIDNGSRFVFVADQDSDEILSFSISARSGVLTPTGTVSTGDGCFPQEMTLDPDSKFLFVSCVGDRANEILRFNVDDRLGSLTQLQQSFPTGTNTRPRGVVVDPSGKFLFSVLGTSNQVSTQSIDAAGNLNLSGVPDTTTGPGPIGIALSKAQ